MRWVTNLVEDWKNNLPLYKMIICGKQETDQECIDRMNRFLKDKVFGEPKATKQMTSQEIKQQGYIGVYKIEKN